MTVAIVEEIIDEPSSIIYLILFIELQNIIENNIVTSFIKFISINSNYLEIYMP